MKISLRKAVPKPFPKLEKGQKPDPTLELERDCSHVCEVEIEGQKPLKFVGGSRKGAMQQFIDHMSFCLDAYVELLCPEDPATPAKTASIEREMTAAGFKMPSGKPKESEKPEKPKKVK